MITVNSGPDCQVVRNYGIARDEWGKVVTLLIAVPRKNPSGVATGRSDTILVKFRCGFDPTPEEAVMIVEASALQQGQFFSFTGNLHAGTTVNGSERKFTGYISGKTIETPYKLDARKKVDEWVARVEANKARERQVVA